MRSYAIVPVVDVDQVMIDACVQSSLGSLRISVDGTLSVLKYDGAVPSLTGYPTYTEADILGIVQGVAWNNGD